MAHVEVVVRCSPSLDTSHGVKGRQLWLESEKSSCTQSAGIHVAASTKKGCRNLQFCMVAEGGLSRFLSTSHEQIATLINMRIR
jgi:hypothetical protein